MWCCKAMLLRTRRTFGESGSARVDSPVEERHRLRSKWRKVPDDDDIVDVPQIVYGLRRRLDIPSESNPQDSHEQQRRISRQWRSELNRLHKGVTIPDVSWPRCLLEVSMMLLLSLDLLLVDYVETVVISSLVARHAPSVCIDCTSKTVFPISISLGDVE
jgi:hypothetical protein